MKLIASSSSSSSLLLGWLSWLVVHTNKGPSNVVTAFVSSPAVPRSTTPPAIAKTIPPTRITTTNRRSYFHATTRLFNQPLATEGDWSAYLDENNTGFVYYFNSVTGQSLWEKPTPTFPDVNLSGEAQRRADQQKEAYLKEQQARAAGAAPAKKGFFGSILETPAPKETVSEPQKTKDWFGPSLFADALPERPTTQKEKADEKAKGDWFGSLFASTTSTDEEKKVENRAQERRRWGLEVSLVACSNPQQPPTEPLQRRQRPKRKSKSPAWQRRHLPSRFSPRRTSCPTRPRSAGAAKTPSSPGVAPLASLTACRGPKSSTASPSTPKPWRTK